MIGRLLALVGIVIIGFGIFGIVRSTQSIPGLGSIMQVATDAKAREAQLCKPGEKLEEAKGASQYTPGQGYGSSVTLYCVNNDGIKRDVTAEFARGGCCSFQSGPHSNMPARGLNFIAVLQPGQAISRGFGSRVRIERVIFLRIVEHGPTVVIHETF